MTLSIAPVAGSHRAGPARRFAARVIRRGAHKANGRWVDHFRRPGAMDSILSPMPYPLKIRPVKTPKSSGGFRLIYPQPKWVEGYYDTQACLYQQAIKKGVNPHCGTPLTSYLFGLPGCGGIVENAARHAGKRYVYTCDLHNFFDRSSAQPGALIDALVPQGCFEASAALNLGERYHPAWWEQAACWTVYEVPHRRPDVVAQAESRLRSYLVRYLDQVGVTQETWRNLVISLARALAKLYCAGPGYIMQGFSFSPILASMLALPMDAEILTLCQEHGVTYTRYVDDMTFSADSREALQPVIAALPAIVEGHGHKLAAHKSRFFDTQYFRAHITGMSAGVSADVTPTRAHRRAARAAAHRVIETWTWWRQQWREIAEELGRPERSCDLLRHSRASALFWRAKAKAAWLVSARGQILFVARTLPRDSKERKRLLFAAACARDLLRARTSYARMI